MASHCQFTILETPLRLDGRLCRVVRAVEEWDTELVDPGPIISELRSRPERIDIFTFIQRLPQSRPRFEYLMEWDNVAALPIRDYEYWYNNQLHRNARNKVKKAIKAGLELKEVPFGLALWKGIQGIQNEIRIRQGRPYAYYGKDIEWIRERYGTYLERARFVGAFFHGELIGFLKLVQTEGYTRTMGILAKAGCRDLAPMNALIAKGVEICAERGDSYLVYGKYDYGKVGSDSVVSYKFHNGFEHILIPRYYIPLTSLGRLVVRAGLQHGLVGYLPRPWVQRLRDLKVSYFERKYRNSTKEALEGARDCSTRHEPKS